MPPVLLLLPSLSEQPGSPSQLACGPLFILVKCCLACVTAVLGSSCNGRQDEEVMSAEFPSGADATLSISMLQLLSPCRMS